MRTLRPLAALALLAVAGCGGPVFFAEVEEQRLCLLLPAQSIPAAPPLGDGTVTFGGQLDLGSRIPGLDKPGAVTGEIHMLSLAVTGSTDLSGVSAATVAVTDAQGVTSTFMHYTRPAPVTAPDRLDMVLDQDLNLLTQLQGGTLGYTLRFQGAPPQLPWSADVEACLSLEITIDPMKL